jgi:small subunit ribosomal protein S20
MANIKSAIKRIDITKRNTLENRRYSSNVKTYTKKYLMSLESYKLDPSNENFERLQNDLSMAYSKIDKAAKKNVIHKNTAARKKSNLRKTLNSIKLPN